MILDRADYKKDSKDLDPAIANTAELKFVKNRDGISGVSVALNTELSTQRFYDPSVFDDFNDAPKVNNPYAAFGKSEFDPKDQFVNDKEDAPF